MTHVIRKVKRKLRYCFRLHERELRSGYWGALVLLILAILIRLLSGSPYRVWLLLAVNQALPPLWILSLVDGVLTLAMGFACGLIMASRRKSEQCAKYRGGMFFVLLFSLRFAAYPLLFRGAMLAASVICMLLTCLSGVICSKLFFDTHRLSGLVAICFLIWNCYLTMLLFSCILSF